MTIATENILFNWRVAQITGHCRAIESYTHLLVGNATYDTALEKLDLRSSAKELRDAADKLERLGNALRSPPTAFPDYDQPNPEELTHARI